MEPSRKRKAKENKPVLAICYDFDKTLSPDDMQAQGYIQSVYKEDVASFWQESNKLAEDNEMDTNLAYMFMMVREARGKIVLTKESLQKYGSEVKLFPGVDTWFKRIKDYGEKNGVIVEHYIISSGLKEMIEGTEVAKEGSFEKIYASSFMFDDRNVPIWPAQVINYTNKTQFLFRIEKGILDVNDSGVNDFFAPEDIRVPFRNIVYIGDSDTDIPCMKLVNSYGGHSIGVPLAVSARKSFIVPSATMTIHPVRMNGLLLGIPQTLSYFERMQERIINFVSKNSRIKPERFRELMMKKDELVMDVGSVLDGETAVNEGLIDSLGGLSDAVQCLYSLIEQQKTDKESTKRTKYSTGKTVSKKRASSATAKTDTKIAGKGKATARVSTFREYHPSAQRAEMRAKRGAENVSDRCR